MAEALKQGDRAFIVSGRPGETVVFWVARRSEIIVREVGEECRLPLSAPTLVVYETWTALIDGTVPPHFLRALAACCEDELWMYSMRREGWLPEAIAAAGLKLRQRLFYRSLLRRFRNIAFVSCGEPDRIQAGSSVGLSQAGL